jgi:predicted HTH transcriptional regulator
LEKERVNTIALREAVINAIVHNDYTKGVPLVEIFSDRIVITSCGGLVEGLSEYDFFKCRSMPRNRELMRVFRDMELVEQIGSGMSRILKAYDPSIFELTPSFTIVTFPFERSFISSNDKADNNKKSNTKTTLDVIRDDPTATIKHISELTRKSPRTITRELKEYQDTGLLRHEGARKNGKWVISSGGFMR